MNKRTKMWLIIAASLILIGCIIFGGVMMATKGDFSKLSTIQYDSGSVTVSEEFSSISIDCSSADITLVQTQDEFCSIVSFTEKKLKPTVSVKDGTLVIDVEGIRKWYDHIRLFSRKPKITVNLPGTQYDTLLISGSTGDIKIPGAFTFQTVDITQTTGDVTNCASASNLSIKVSTGDIHTENISANSITLCTTTGSITGNSVACGGDLNIQIRTGHIKLTDIVCNNLTATGKTGDMRLKNLTAAQQLSVTTSTGDVKFDRCDAGQLAVKTGTGDVTGSLLSEKIFIATAGTGDIDVPKTTTGGICEITTSTGDIKITLP